MLPSFIITFREVLEAALVVGIILSYLVRVKQTKYNTVVYAGIISGIVASIIGAVLFTKLAGGFTGRAEEIFEGITMLVGAALLTTMILWMMKQKHIAKELENRVSAELTEAHKFGIFSLVFVAILREGIETVVFLRAATLVSTGSTMIGALVGIIAAILLGYAIFLGSMKINIKRFFNITSMLLILFAAGLVAHGVHELQEAKGIPTVIENIWDVNPPVNLDGSYPILHEKGHVGSILKSLFGYNGNPSLIEGLSYLLYITLVIGLWRNIEKSKNGFIKKHRQNIPLFQ
ncbi:MAG: FTR1 family protein [Deltaproteobacteria bacterium]|nr:FTR1 family protein [Deltaproteobacteria bacterium]